MFMIRITLSIAAVLFALSAARSESEHGKWYFSAQEMEVAYKYQESFGKRLPDPLRIGDCLVGKEVFVASHQGEEFSVPCRVVTETIRHLREILKKRAAKYLFPLDAHHAHLAIPSHIWEKRYKKLPGNKILQALLWEPELMALYHTAEHLAFVDPKSGKVDPRTRAWVEKRNVIGFYDGRPVQILPAGPLGFGKSEPEGYTSGAMLYFLAHQSGNVTIYSDGRSVTFDLSFVYELPRVDPF